MIKTMVNSDDLKRAGFTPSTASKIIRQAKHYMIQLGYEFYEGRRISVVPIQAVKSVIGDIELSETEDD